MKHTISVKITGPHGLRLDFSGGGYIYVNPEELNTRIGSKKQTTYFDDGNHQGVVQTYRLMLVEWPGGSTNGEHPGPIHQYFLDTVHLCLVLKRHYYRYLSAFAAWKDAGNDDYKFRFPEIVMDLDRFNESRSNTPLLTAAQMLKHPNCCFGHPSREDRQHFAATLLNFRRHIKPELQFRLMEELSRYLSHSLVWGCYSHDEFYFDGRRATATAPGCGFNGAFILREESRDFSIHT